MSTARALRWLALILLVAGALRGGRWLEERQGVLSRVPAGDERTYDMWAQQIAAGREPDRVPYQAPLPAWVQAAGHLLASPPVARDAYRLLGVALGLGTVLLTFLLGRRLGGAPVGLVAAALVALHRPLIFYEPTLLRDGGATFLLTLAAWLLLDPDWLEDQAPRAGARALRALGLGLVLGVGALWRENLLLVGAGLVAVFGVWQLRRGRPRLGLALALGLCLPLTPVWLSNWRLEGRPSPFPTWNGGCVFYIANQQANRGVGYLRPPFVPHANAEAEVAGFTREAVRLSGRPLTPHQVSRFWLQRGLGEVLGDPGLYLRKLALRTCYLLASQELVHARDLRLARRESLPLSLPLPGFGLLVGFAALGAWELRRRRRVQGLLLVLLLFLGSTLLVTFVTRYRLPAVPLVAVLASLGLAAATRALRRPGSSARRSWRLACGLALGLLCTSIPVPYDAAAAHWSRCLAWMELGEHGRALDALEQVNAQERGAYWVRLARLALQNGERDVAGQALERALALNPADPRARALLGAATSRPRR